MARKLIVSLESSDQQQHTLEDYIEASFMLQYNKRYHLLYNVNKWFGGVMARINGIKVA